MKTPGKAYDINTMDNCPRCGAKNVMYKCRIPGKYGIITGTSCFICGHWVEPGFTPKPIPTSKVYANRRSESSALEEKLTRYRSSIREMRNNGLVWAEITKVLSERNLKVSDTKLRTWFNGRQK